jgi:4'-phosphopantetheinyl transferase
VTNDEGRTDGPPFVHLRDDWGVVLPPHAVHVWFTRPDAVSRERRDAYLPLLSLEERTRYGRFLFDRDRETFLVAHAQLRLILSRYADVPAAQWVFVSGENGRPFIASPTTDSPRHFNLSHTEGLVAIAISRIAETGIDAEHAARRVNRTLVGPRVFTARELAWIEEHPGGEGDRFFQLWTLKEAYAKARGLGLSIDFRRIHLDIGVDRIAIGFDPAAADPGGEWQFRLLRPADGYVCGVAVRQPPAPIEVVTFTGDGL